MTQHLPIVADLGWTQGEITEALTGKLGPTWDDGDRALVSFVDELLHTVTVSDETFDKTARHFSNREIVELTMIPGFYRMLAGYVNVMRIPHEEAAPSFVKFANAPSKVHSQPKP